MEVKADVVHTDVAEAWVRRQQEAQPTPPVKPEIAELRGLLFDEKA